MTHTRLRSRVSAFALLTIFALTLVSPWRPVSSQASTSANAQDSVLAKIDPRLLEALTRGASPDASAKSATRGASEKSSAVSFWLTLADQADLSAAAALPSKEEKAQYVYQTLRAFAERTQPAVSAELDRMGLKHQAFWITNAILVEADAGQDAGTSQAANTVQPARGESLRQQVLQLAARSDIKRLELAERGQWALDVMPAEAPQPARTAADLPAKLGALKQWRASTPPDDSMVVNAPNLDFVRAPEIWEHGFTGQGIVIANIDTGVRWDHEALKANYRGSKKWSVNHNYNWWDAIRSGASADNVCGNASPVPCDDFGHGTHTMGTAVGRTGVDSSDGLTKRIGIAPGARWIACRAFDQGAVVPGAVENCLQFFLAPTDLSGQNPDPAKAPDVINHSYGVPDTPTLRTAFNALTTAGVYNVAASGNLAICSSITAPGIYTNVLTVSALGFNLDIIALFSSKGPGPQNLQKPDLAAPGQNVTSADKDGGLIAKSGTSQASPLVAGAVALVWSARPDLRGDISGTTELFHRTGRPRLVSQCASPQQFPNNVYGYGNLDAKATFDDNQSPVPHCQSVTVTAGANCLANASINNGSFDPDGNALRFTQAPRGPYPIGDTLVTLNMTDRRGARNFCQATVTVVDATPPMISKVSVNPSVIWPPNNKLVNVAVNYITSDCTDVTTSLSVSSNEPTAAGDIVVIDEHHVSLRATRLGSGRGRIYTITIEVTDSSGNVSSRQVNVSVPHDQEH